jgi:DNA-binding IclR family transcriptional regulator
MQLVNLREHSRAPADAASGYASRRQIEAGGTHVRGRSTEAVGDDTADKGADTNKATVRVLEVLSLFAADVDSYGVTEVATLLGMSKNMAFRALSTLVDQGYLFKSSGGRYELGLRVVELLNPYQREPDLRELAQPYIERLHRLTGETVRLAVASGDLIVNIDGIEPMAPIVSRVAIGATFPLHLGPMARAVLASLPDARIDDYIARHRPLRGVTPQSITSEEKLRADVKAVRAQGFARGLGDLTPGLVSVAFPIVDACDVAWGTVGIGGPSDRFTPQRLDGMLGELKAVAAELNAVTRLYCADLPGSAAGTR